jgi:hypothetical protein
MFPRLNELESPLFLFQIGFAERIKLLIKKLAIKNYPPSNSFPPKKNISSNPLHIRTASEKFVFYPIIQPILGDQGSCPQFIACFG